MASSQAKGTATRIGLKLFYLRTREAGLSQQAVARELGVRQATISDIERGHRLPSVPLLLELSRYYDVTPTFLLDTERGVVPLPTDRWDLRNAHATVGMWLETSEAVRVANGKLLCRLLPGGRIFDDEAARARLGSTGTRKQPSLGSIRRARASAERKLVSRLQAELAAHPQHRNPRSGT